MITVFVILLCAVVLFVTEVLPIDLVGVLMLVALTLTGVLTTEEALSGFSDPAVITIAGFFVVSAAFFNTGIVEALGRKLYRVSGSSRNRLLTLLMFTAAGVASFMSNVVTTAVLMPAVMGVARRMKQPASLFLMPLAFGAVLGGKITLVGSPTNLAVNGLLPNYGMQPFGLFEFAPLGIPMLFAGILFMAVIGVRLLPKHSPQEFEEPYPLKEYISEVVVRPGSPAHGKTLAEVDFRGTYDLQVLGIVRNGEQKLPHRDSELCSGDILLVKGKVERILSIKDAQGLHLRSDKATFRASDAADTTIVEAILSPTSAFAGRTLQQIRFASRFGADVLGIYRHHQALYEKLSDIRLQFGDVLIIQGRSRNIESLRQDPNFLTLDDVEHTPLRNRRALWAVAICTVAILLAAFKLVPIAVVALTAAAGMVVARCINIREAYSRVEWNALVLIGSTIPLGLAMEKTGAAKLLAGYVTGFLGFGGPMLILAGFFLFTVVLTQPMSNAACALILAPIAINVAQQLGVDPRPFAMTIAIAASCTFPTPLEPVTAIIYGPGKYRFSDYLRVGIPLTLVLMAVTLVVVPLVWPL